MMSDSVQRKAYGLSRNIFWRLPSGVRKLLHGLRHRFIRWVRNSRSPTKLTSRDPLDIPWEYFEKNVLARRGEFKGIFVQEVVIDWSVPLYQRPQHMACALGRLGYLVIYKTSNWTHDNIVGIKNVAENVWVTASDKVDFIPKAVHSFYSTAYSIRPELIQEKKKSQCVVYEYIDHIDQEISGDKENIRRLLALKKFAFNGGADYIVASSGKLYDEAVQECGRDRVILVQNGVDTEHYRSPVHIETLLPAEYLNFCERHLNVVGYFGAIAPWLWYEVLVELVASRTDLGFVFIGPDYYGGVDKLPKAENFLQLPAVDYKILPAHAKHFDICLIPFKPGEIARTTSPLKLFEYFALEKPVVVTEEMLECIAFPEVLHGNTAEKLGEAIDAAILQKNCPKFRKKLRELADTNDWNERAKQFEKVFAHNDA
jgi:hypothetical protein